MKKFTLIIALSVITVVAHSENKNDQQTKMKKTLEKIQRNIQRTDVLTRIAGNVSGKMLVYKGQLKNAMASQKLDSIVSKVLNRETMIWNNDWKDEFVYNSEMKNTGWIEHEWHVESNFWFAWSKTETQYDNEGKLSALILYYSDGQSPDMVGTDRLEVYYNPEGILDSAISYTITENNSMTLDGKQYYFYNSSSQLIQSDMWTMEGLEGEEELTKSISILYEYDLSGKLIKSSLYYIFDGEPLLFSRSEHSYNSSGQLVTTEVSGLDMFFEFEISNRSVYEYNSEGDISAEVYSIWSSNSNSWIEQYQYEYIYGSFDFSEVIFPSYSNLIFGMTDRFMNPYNKIITGKKTLEMLSGNWVNIENLTYYYSGITTNINDNNFKTVSVYPNPTTDYITIRWNNNVQKQNLEIYNISGSLVMEKEVNSGNEISVSHLNSGVYLLKLLDKKQIIYNTKLMKY